jgi:hypothetical protein
MSNFSLSNIKNRFNVEDPSEPVHTYFDLDIVNNDVAPFRVAPQLTFDEIRQNAFLANPSQYYLSIVRFQLDSQALPVFVPQVRLGQSDIDSLIYGLTLNYTGATSVYTSGLTYVDYYTQDTTLNQPPAPVPADAFEYYQNPYYFIYSVQQWVDLVNLTFQTAMNNLNNAVVAGGETLPSTIPPFLTVDTTTNLMTLYVPQLLAQATFDVNFNAPMYALFSSFNATQTGQNNYQIITNDSLLSTNGLNTVTLNSVVYQKFTQEYSVVSVWSAVKAIVFTTSLIPVNPSLSGDPVVFGSGSLKISNGNNNNITSILTDYQVDNQRGNDYKGTVQYTPTAEYRLFDLLSNAPLASISLQAFWKDRYSNLIPLNLPSGCSASMKLLFRSKTFNAEKK